MNNNQIEALKYVMRSLRHNEALCWENTNNESRKVKLIGPPPRPVDPSDEPEPSECAYFSNGDYVALYNAEPSAFFIKISLKDSL